MTILLEMLDHVSSDQNFLTRVITSDEIWMILYDPETTWQSLEWHIPNSCQPKKARMILLGQSVNLQFYLEIFKCFRIRVNCIRLEINDSWILHYANAWPHMTLDVTEYLTEEQIQMLPYPPSISYQAPSF